MKSIKDLVLSSLTLALSLTIVTFTLGFGVANASSNTSANKLTTIQARADREIDQRTTLLARLTTQVSSSTKLNSSDKTALSSELSSETSGLTALKVKIDGDTTADQASTDEADIFTTYRVYAVVVVKVELLIITDNQQNIEAKLTTQSQALQLKITADQTAGKDLTDVATAQTELTTMEAQISNAHQISTTIESDVSPILPPNWNANHNIFKGNRAELTSAYHQNQLASSAANNIASILKTIKN